MLAVPGDYDGDGDTEPAWFDNSTATWHIHGRSAPLEFGTGVDEAADELADTPAPGDYDGDGVTDPATFSPTDRTLRILGQDPIEDLSLGLPIVADLDDDGIDEVVMFDPSAYVWRFADGTVLNPGIGAEFQLPLVADFNGDGTVELAVQVTDEGRWVSSDGELATDPRAAWNGSVGSTRLDPVGGHPVHLADRGVRGLRPHLQSMAVFLYRLRGVPLGDDPPCATAPFPDVPADHPFCGEITWLADARHRRRLPRRHLPTDLHHHPAVHGRLPVPHGRRPPRTRPRVRPQAVRRRRRGQRLLRRDRLAEGPTVWSQGAADGLFRPGVSGHPPGHGRLPPPTSTPRTGIQGGATPLDFDLDGDADLAFVDDQAPLVPGRRGRSRSGQPTRGARLVRRARAR